MVARAAAVADAPVVDQTAGAESQGAEQATAPAAPSFAEIAALIVDMKTSFNAEMADLRAQVERSKTAAPSFRQMDQTTNPQSIQAAMAQVMPGQDPIGGQLRYMPIGTDSHPLPDEIANRYQQEYDGGDAVRLRLETRREGHPKTWGEIAETVGLTKCPTMVRKRNCPGRYMPGEACASCGFGPTVKKVYWFEPRLGEWCYLVRIPGITGSNGQMMYGSELELR